MVSKRDGKIVVWPRYFDVERTRKEGRRVPKDLAVREPKAGIIAEAAKTLGLEVELEREAAHPTHWWKPEGRVLIEKKWTKEETLKKIAGRL
ncbi:MAG: signal recognition particle subunit SRP19/SEC65 family protein [Euryarchaeota archaeon]|nr:signal recognition particle subunit SRP19/SEC65 family protein [Euryarchaeota archaeon]